MITNTFFDKSVSYRSKTLSIIYFRAMFTNVISSKKRSKKVIPFKANYFYGFNFLPYAKIEDRIISFV